MDTSNQSANPSPPRNSYSLDDNEDPHRYCVRGWLAGLLIIAALIIGFVTGIVANATNLRLAF